MGRKYSKGTKPLNVNALRKFHSDFKPAEQATKTNTMAESLQTKLHFASADTGVKKTNIYYIPFSRLQLAKDRVDPTKKFNRRIDLGPKEDLQELAKSLYEQGPREPLKAKKVKGEERYDVYQGERRYTAADIAFKTWGVDIIFPVLLYPLEATWKDIAFDTLLSNDGKPLNPLEKAESVQHLIEEGATEEEAAKGLGCSSVYIMNLLRLNSLPAKAKKLITEGTVSATLIMQFLKKKNLDLDSLIEEIQEAAKQSKDGKVKAKDLRKNKDAGEAEEGEEEETPSRAASSIGEFKRFRRQNPGTYKDQRAQEEFEFVCSLIDNQVSYSQILERYTGK